MAEEVKKSNALEESWNRILASLAHAMGDKLIKYMQDDNVTEIMVNPDCTVWVDTFDKGCVYAGFDMHPMMSREVIYKVAALTKQVIDEKNYPAIQAEIPDSHLFDSARFQGELPKIVANPSFNIRKHPKKILTLDDYVERKCITPYQKDVIINAILAKKNIVAAGGTNTGKTTFLNAILHEMSKLTDRIVMIEDTPELRCSAKNVVSFRTYGDVDMTKLLRFTLRKSPNRIVVGEVRGGEALDLLKAWGTGHPGGCSTVHSDSAIDTLLRLEAMVDEVSMKPQCIQIGRSVDMVVYLKKEDTRRFVDEIIEVESYDKKKGEYITKKIT